MFQFIVLLAIASIHGQTKFFGSVWQWNSSVNCPSEFKNLFNQTTPENAGKWGTAEPSQGKFSWQTLDAMYDYANDTQQLHASQILFPMIWENASVQGVTLWGDKQGAIWRTNAYLVRLLEEVCQNSSYGNVGLE